MNVHRKPRGERMTLAATIPKYMSDTLCHMGVRTGEGGGFPGSGVDATPPPPIFVLAKIDISIQNSSRFSPPPPPLK